MSLPLCASVTILSFTWAGGELSQTERLAIEARRAILSCEVTAENSWWSTRHGDKSWKSHIWVSGDLVREDQTDVVGGDGSRQVRCATPTENIWWTDSHIGLGEAGGVAIHRWRGAYMGRQTWTTLPLDPRLIGLIFQPAGGVRGRNLKNVDVGLLDRHNVEIEDISYADQPSIQVVYEKANGVKVRVITSNDVGGNIVFMEARNEKRNGRESVSTEYEFHKREGKWFPSKCHYERVSAGEVETRDDVSFEVVSLNEPINPEVFHLAGMKFPSGKMITTKPPDAKGKTYWNGTKEVPGIPITSVARHEESSPWLYRVGVVLCVAIAAGCIWFYARSRK